MDKAILVIDMPNYCSECILCRENDFCHEMCIAANERIFTSKKPDWCPLKPVPEKIDVPDWDNNIKANNKNAEEIGIYMYDRGHYRGYNICIDKILGE